MNPNERSENNNTNNHPQVTPEVLFNAAYQKMGDSFKSFGSAFSSAGDASAALTYGIQAKEAQIVFGGLDYGMHAIAATGHAIAATGHEMAAENPEVVDSVRAAGDLLSGASNRMAAFAATRPGTYAAEQSIPLVGGALSTVDGLARGGLPSRMAALSAEARQQAAAAHPAPPAPEAHPAHPPAAATVHPADAASAHPVPARNADAASAHPTPATDAHAGQPEGTQTRTEHRHSVTVHNGDGYWQVAKRIVGSHSSNRVIANMANHLQHRNGGKDLQPGDHLTYLKA